MLAAFKRAVNSKQRDDLGPDVNVTRWPELGEKHLFCAGNKNRTSRKKYHSLKLPMQFAEVTSLVGSHVLSYL